MTDVIDTTWLDATAQADLVRRGELTPKDLVEAAIARIESRPRPRTRARHYGDDRAAQLPARPQPLAHWPLHGRVVRRLRGRGSQRDGAGRSRQ